MRCLDTTTYELHSREQEFFKSQGYAILSHRWVGAEITFDTLARSIPEMKNAVSNYTLSPQQSKIRGACETARQLGFAWVWIDNCCINKGSSTEESESINSMFKWYRDAQICITYLSDVKLHGGPGNPPAIFQSIKSPQPSEWFFRGWTLQELLAPRKMNFYDKDWNYMGTKDSLAHEIERVTGISAAYLTGAQPFRGACIATKMSWMVGRQTAREEDIAYSMLGVFGVFMAPQYGEGQNAFMRLQNILQSSTPDESLYAWRMPQPSAGRAYGIEVNPNTSWGPDEWGLLAPTPDWFRGCGNVLIEGGVRIPRSIEAFVTTPEGVRIETMLSRSDRQMLYLCIALVYTFVCTIPAIIVTHKVRTSSMDGAVYPLNCWMYTTEGTLAAVSIRLGAVRSGGEGLKFKRIGCSELLLEKKYTTSTRQAPPRMGVMLQPKIRYDD